MQRAPTSLVSISGKKRSCVDSAGAEFSRIVRGAEVVLQSTYRNVLALDAGSAFVPVDGTTNRFISQSHALFYVVQPQGWVLRMFP